MLMNMLLRKKTYYKQETFTELFTPTHVFSSLRPHNDKNEKAILYIQTYSEDMSHARYKKKFSNFFTSTHVFTSLRPHPNTNER